MAQHIHTALAEIRNEAGLAQRELAKRLGREHSFVARIEQGERRVDLVEFYLICKACETSPQKAIDALYRKFIAEM